MVMMLSFITPAALWALLLLPLMWGMAWLTRRVNLARLGSGRYALLLILRSLMLLALILALAGTQVVRAVEETAVVFLVDGSDSFAPALRQQALDYINTAYTTAQPGDQAGVVVFGGSAAVERAPAAATPLTRFTSLVPGGRTDIAAAIQLGLALLPADAQKRLVLLSDGGENMGRAADAARLAALRGVPIEVVPLSGQEGADVILTALLTPATASENQRIPLRLRIQSSVAGPATVTIFADGQLIVNQEIDLPVGSSEFVVDIDAGQSGFRRFESRIEAPADTQPLNNRAAAFTIVEGPPLILLVAGVPERAAPLQAALRAAGLRVEVIAPTQIPADQTKLRNYAAVVLVDVPALQVSSPVQQALHSYVQDNGGSLAMIGGSESFGAGGWRRSPLAPALPVELEPPNREERPDLGLALVIDRSGSMSDVVSGTRTRLDLAKEAVYQATLGLDTQDQLGIFVFDDVAQTVLEMQKLPDIAQIETVLSGVSEGGGTDIRSGIALATEAMRTVDAKIRHVILLTDGQADDNYADLIDQMRADGVTITIVAVGDQTNPLLQSIAQRGGGAYYRVSGAADVPQIFLAETVRVAKRDIVEETFTPAVALAVPPVRDLRGLPALYGYNATTPRDAARTLLVAPDGAPILAVWQYGLGRSLAWTSDLKGQWAKDLIAWDGFPQLAAGMIDALLPPMSSEVVLESQSDGPQAILNLYVSGGDGVPQSAAQVEGQLVDPNGGATSLSFTQVGPGHYRAVSPAEIPGAYLASVVALDAAGQPLGAAQGGVVVSYSPEYGLRRSDPALLADLAALTGGRVNPMAESLFTPTGQRVGQVREIALPLIWLALALLPFDIALRRIFLRREYLPRIARQPAPVPVQDVGMARLQAARARTRRPTSPPPSIPPVVAPPPPAQPPPSPAPSAPPSVDSIENLLAAKRRRGK
nr:VWA domain-containing protein [Oscillochloris trichoides]